MLLGVPYFSSGYTEYREVLVASFAISYGISFVVSVCLLGYGVYIVREHHASYGGRKKIAVFAASLSFIVLTNVGRLFISAVVWLSAYLRNSNRLDVAFAGLDLNVLRFESYVVAQTFYVVAFVIPDTLPSVLLLTLILLSLRTRSTSGEKDTPLLTEDTDESEVPMQYAE